ncbi:Asp-tRNA(Asn)/Glu-tRNA(Gln) amidotransferase subunit GatC [Geoglobus sp.]
MIDENVVRHVANLSKIELRDEEVERFKKDFERIIEFFNQLDEVDADVEPTHHVLPLKNVFRDDVPGEGLDREKALMNARHKEEGYFKGPRVVE